MTTRGKILFYSFVGTAVFGWLSIRGSGLFTYPALLSALIFMYFLLWED